MRERRQDANPKVEAVKWKYQLISVERPGETGAETQTRRPTCLKLAPGTHSSWPDAGAFSQSLTRPRETGAKTQTLTSKPFGASTPHPKPELADFTYQ